MEGEDTADKDTWLVQRIGLKEREPTLFCSVHPLCQKCATAKVNKPDTWDIRAGLNKNVVQLDVPVEHTPRVNLN